MLTPVSATAPAKVNLFLGCGPRREDGYHELITIFQAVDLRETVTLTPTGRTTRDRQVIAELTVSGLDAQHVPTDASNLAARALQALADYLPEGQELPVVKVHITKAVPTAGGMAGGSADAAAALRAGNELFGGKVSEEQLYRDIAVRLGADVPFCLFGGTMLGTGRGDELRAVPSQGQYHWVFGIFRHGLSTPEVFAAIDQLADRQPHLDPTAVLQSLAAGDTVGLARALHNDLEAAALTLRPDVAQAVAAAAELGALRAVVSGSGPTVAFLCADAAAAGKVAERLRQASLCDQVVTASA